MPTSPKSSPKKKPLFKTRKSREDVPQAGDTVTPPKAIAQAIDAFRECQEQAKHFEGEATVHKDKIMDFSQEQHCERVMNGTNRSFKVLGDETMVTYVVMDASAGLTDDDVEAFRERWGDKAADALITRDLASVRFDGAVFEANYDAIEKALSALPDKVLENLFKPMLMKAQAGAVERAKDFVKNADELREMIQMLKIKNYVR